MSTVVSDARTEDPPGAALGAYVAGLPHGLDTHPGCRIKAAFSRSLLEELPAPPKGLPEPIAALVDRPPMINAWIPEVHHQALMLGTVDDVFAGDEDAFLAVMLTMQRRLLRRKIYAPLLQLIDPSRLLMQAARRWANFHRGTKLEVERTADREARLWVTHPRGLYSPLGLRSLASGFRAAVEAARSHRAEVAIAEATPESTEFHARWDS